MKQSEYKEMTDTPGNFLVVRQVIHEQRGGRLVPVRQTILEDISDSPGYAATGSNSPAICGLSPALKGLVATGLLLIFFFGFVMLTLV